MLGFEGAFFDAVSIWHVLEHTQNPSKVLREISRVLKPGGVLALAVPNFGSTQARLFGKNWFHLDLPRHLFHFTEPMLTKMLRDTGLEPVRVSTHSIHQNLYGFIQSLLNGLFPRTPNKLFNFLKGGNKKESSLAGMLPHLAVASSAFPLAVLETAWSGGLGLGRKPDYLCTKERLIDAQFASRPLLAALCAPPAAAGRFNGEHVTCVEPGSKFSRHFLHLPVGMTYDVVAGESIASAVFAGRREPSTIRKHRYLCPGEETNLPNHTVTASIPPCTS
jgi:hypothetical protein